MSISEFQIRNTISVSLMNKKCVFFPIWRTNIDILQIFIIVESLHDAFSLTSD